MNTTTDCPRLTRAGYARYMIASGPAKGTFIERSTNPHCLPRYRWVATDGPYAHASNDGWRLRNLARSLTRLATEDAIR